jgi:flagellar biosynthetic protein FliP
LLPWRSLITAGLLAVPGAVCAAPARSATAGAMTGSVQLGVPMQVVAVLALLAVLPAVVMSATPFLRITLVLHFLRQALGTQTAPSNQVLVGLSLFLTALLMQPVVERVRTDAWVPYQAGAIPLEDALRKATPPVRDYLLRFAREKDLELMLELAHAPAPRSASDLDLRIVLPAYVLSELRTGFQIGAVLFLPFLVIDLVVASVTLVAGMVQLPPVMLSAPFKILLFVLVDGWNLVVGSLVKSFA